MSQFDADFWCQQHGGGAAVAAECPLPMDTGEPEPDPPAQPWEPGTHVSFDARAGAYLVDEAFVAELLADPSQLDRDAARLVVTADGGYYELAHVEHGNLADVMGLRSGDVLLDVNGYDLGTVDGQVAAFTDLQHEEVFVLSFERDDRFLTATYIIVGENPQ